MRATPFVADLHVHSRYSRACSRDCDLEHLAWWAARKGIGLVGTGDLCHPAWAEEIRTKLVPAEPGLFRLRPDLERDVLASLPAFFVLRTVNGVFFLRAVWEELVLRRRFDTYEKGH